jgi:hypothetical protein
VVRPDDERSFVLPGMGRPTDVLGQDLHVRGPIINWSRYHVDGQEEVTITVRADAIEWRPAPWIGGDPDDHDV